MKKLTAVIDRFEEEKAVLKLESNQTLIIHIDYLPEGAKEGSVLQVFFELEEAEGKKREKQAKEILNELLKAKD